MILAAAPRLGGIAVLMSMALAAGTPLTAGDFSIPPMHSPLQLAASEEPQLPPAPPPIGVLRRGKNGQLEVVDPTEEQGAGQRLCAAGTVCVGPNQAYQTLSQALAVARDGDVIEVVAGTYHETAKLVRRNLTVRGVAGRPHFDCKGLTPSDGKGCLLLAADGITLDNLEISGAELSEAAGANGACIRNEPNMSFTVLRVSCHTSQEGILSVGGTIVIENSEFFDNGWTGSTHNVYFGGDCPSVTVRGSTFRDARVGHEFKSRCRKTMISDSTFRSTKGSRDIDIPDGGETMIYRSMIMKGPGAQSAEIVGFAAESCRYPASLVLKQVRISNSNFNAAIHNFNTCAGYAVVLQEVTFEGSPPRLVGYILKQ
jgi:hypothetical protein